VVTRVKTLSSRISLAVPRMIGLFKGTPFEVPIDLYHENGLLSG
jgi:hypothetical protein